MTVPIRLFVSSPSDVAAERQAVERVARRVEGLFDGVQIEVYRWEKDHYYSAHTGFQEQIAKIGGFDLVVGVLWSRLGSPLPPSFAARMPPPREGEPYPSGTAFELLEAIRLRRERDHAPPDIFVYRKLAPANFAAADDVAAQARLLADLERVSQFMTDFFANEEEGFKAAYKTFLRLDEFDAALETDLTAWLMANHRIGGQHPWDIEKRGAPFVGLDAFEASHREVFFGRRPEIERARERLEAGQGFLLIDGASGTGKSSLARAGLLPRLTDLDPHLRVAITVPETETPLLALVQALFGSAALPDLAQGDYPQPAALARHLMAGGDIAPILRALERAGHRLMAENQLEAPPPLTVLLLVDQLEGLFASRVPAAERAAYSRLLEQLVESGRARVIATLRANLREAALAIPSLGRLINANRGLALEPPTADALGEIIRAPAAAAGIAYERDTQGVGLDEVLLAEVAKDPAALPLLQFALERLYQMATDKVRAEGRRLGDVPPGTPLLTLTHADYAAVGGISGAIGQQAEAALRDLKEASRAKLPGLVRALTESGGGALVLGRAPLDRAAPDDESRALVEALVAARILVQGMSAEGDGPSVPTLRFCHERVLTAWDRTREAAKAAATYLRVRAELVSAEARWRREGKANDLLLAPGVRLAEAEKAFADFGPELDALDPALRVYLQASSRRARLRQRMVYAASIVLLVVSLAAGWFGLQAQQAAQTALQSQHNAMVALALSRASTEPQEAIALVLAAWPKEASGPYPTTPLAYQALGEAIRATQPHQILRGHENRVNSVTFSLDGTRIVSGSTDGTLRLWDAATGAPLGEPLRVQEGGVMSVAFTPDGMRVISGDGGGAVRMWDAATGAPIGEPLRGHGGNLVRCVVVSPDGERIVSGGDDSKLRFWDADTGAPQGALLQRLTGTLSHDVGFQVTGIAFSPDGRRIVSVGADSTLRLWDATTGAALGAPLRGHEGWVVSTAFSPDGMLIVSGGADGALRLWDSATLAPRSEPLSGHNGIVYSVAFAPNGKLIVSGGEDGTLRLWDTATGAPLGRPLRGHEGPVLSTAFSPDGMRIVSAGEDGTLRLWDASLGRSGDALRGHEGGVWATAFSPDGTRIASGGDDRTLGLWHTYTGIPVAAPLSGHESTVYSIDFSPDVKQIVSGGGDGTLRLWDAATGAPLGEPLRGHDGWVGSAAFSPDGTRILSAGQDGKLLLWDAATGAPLGQRLRWHRRWVYSVAFSPDGTRIVSGGDDRTVRLWNGATVAPLGEPMLGHAESVIGVAFTPDGMRVISGDGGGAVRMWDAATGAPIGEPLRGHGGGVWSVAFSPDGTRIVSGAGDGTLRLMDAATGALLGETPHWHEGGVLSVAFSPDGRRIVSGGQDGTLRLWGNLPPGNILQVACRYLPHANGRPAFSTEGLAEELGLTNLTLPEDCDTYDPPIPPLLPAEAAEGG